MSRSGRIALTLALGLAAVAPVTLGPISAQTATNPFRANLSWDKLKDRKIGVPSGIIMDNDGKHIWVLDRCGANGCASATTSGIDPILLLDLEGNLVKSFGKGLIGFPHGFAIDPQGNLYVTEGAPTGDARGDDGLKKGLGHQVLKFSPDGKVLMRIGTAAVSGADETHMNGPSGVAVAADGSLWVTDGHGGPQKGPNVNNMFGSRGGNNRLIHFSKDGKFIKAWGKRGSGPGEFDTPHSIAIDSRGRIFVADRSNSRVQIFDQDGKFLDQWKQFGRPSGIYIDRNDNMVVADSQSNSKQNPGYRRGIYVGSARDGKVAAVIPFVEPDPEKNNNAGIEGVAIDAKGNVYGAEVSTETLKKYLKATS